MAVYTLCKGLLLNDTDKATNINYLSLLLKCMAALHYCYLLSLFHNWHYSKLICPNTCLLFFLLLYLLSDRNPPPAVKTMSVCTCISAKWYLLLVCCKFAIKLDLQSSHELDELTCCNARYVTVTADSFLVSEKRLLM